MRKTYEMPSVIMTQMVQSSTVLMVSPGNLQNSGNGTSGLSVENREIIGS